ncbi:MAG: hypothetical protein HQL57_09000 [Magnetococcales bacterium]|nr:hypothetical protein [Magnetococcales bacterium]MBF0157305.1 hypothetical protein [Magnetococcales bacterium]
MTVILRYLYALVALLAVVALPFSVVRTLEARAGFKAAEQRYAEAREKREALAKVRSRIASYLEFSKKVNTFAEAATEARVLPKHWTEYHVDLKDKVVDLTEFRTTLANAKQGPRFYFQPELFEVAAISGADLSKERLDVLTDLERGGSKRGAAPPPAALPLPGGNPLLAAAGGLLGGGKAAPAAKAVDYRDGSRVFLSMKGTYLVFQPK